jgi:hypothetical protein
VRLFYTKLPQVIICGFSSPFASNNFPYSYIQPLSTCGPGRAPASDPGHGSGAGTSVREPGSGPNLISLIHIPNTSTELCVLPRIQFLARMSRPRIHAPDPTPPRSRVRMPTQAGRIFFFFFTSPSPSNRYRSHTKASTRDSAKLHTSYKLIN